MKHTPRPISLLLILALSAPSCTSLNGEDGMGTTALGAGAGALVGAGIGALAGGSAHRGAGMAIGAVAGALLGGTVATVWARSQVKPRSEYPTADAYVAANSAQLDTRISNVQSASRELAAKTSGAQTITPSELQSIMQANASNTQLIQQDITTARAAMTEATPTQKQALQTKLQTLEQERADMAAQIQALTALQA